MKSPGYSKTWKEIRLLEPNNETLQSLIQKKGNSDNQENANIVNYLIFPCMLVGSARECFWEAGVSHCPSLTPHTIQICPLYPRFPIYPKPSTYFEPSGSESKKQSF